MSEPLQTYDRTIKLPGEVPERARPDKAGLDAKITEMIAGLKKGSSRWKGEWHSDDSGNLAATITHPACVMSLQTKFGRNAVYVAKERQKFLSYRVHAESRIASLDRATDRAEYLRLLMKIVGGFLGPIVLFGLFHLILRLLGFVIIPYVLIFFALVIGIWAGGKLGDKLGSAMEQRAEQRAERLGVKPEVDAMWGMLTLKLDQIIEPYPRL